jgi:CPA2 family monovalent cation:H+ antiporter-2
MNHLPQLIQDLALILGAAALTTLLFKKLKQPVVLGYIIAGLLVGPNFKFFPNITDVNTIKIWADIGVIFLLFALGIEFSFKKLVKVGGSAAITGVVELSCMMLLGYGVGKLLGWPEMDCLFLGGIIAISSTTIIFRAFDELGLKSKQFTRLVLGVLVIEDLVAILLMVLLSTVAVSRKFEGWPMIFSIGKLLFFLCLWFVMGIFLLPTFLRRINKLVSNETLLIIALALCFGMVVLAESVGFSAALGAFIMGSILAETTQASKIEHLISSVKDLFGAIFFVSVGMLINPSLLVQYAFPVFLLTCAVVIGKTFFVSIGSLLSGTTLKQSVEAGTSMSQIGEFSFIIATLGVSLNVTSAYLYPIAVGVSVITTFLTPYMIRFAGPLNSFLEKTLPVKWQQRLERYSTGSQTINAESEWRKLIRFYLQVIIINSVIIIALTVLFAHFIQMFMLKHIQNEILAKIVTAVVALLCMAPFIWALTLKRMHKSVYTTLWLDAKYNRGPLVMLEIARNVLTVLLVGFLLRQLFSFWVAIAATVFVMLIVWFIFKQKLQHFYQRIETRFLDNLHAKEKMEAAQAPKHLSPWDAHIVYFDVDANADFVGMSLDKLAWRENYGINITSIERGNKKTYAPKRDEKLYPFDKIGVLGTDLQLQQFKSVIDNHFPTNDVYQLQDNIVLQKIIVDEHTKLKDLTIRDSGIREKTNGLVVGIQRKEERILNPPSDTVFEWDDIVWVVGEQQKIQQLYLQ